MTSIGPFPWNQPSKATTSRGAAADCAVANIDTLVRLAVPVICARRLTPPMPRALEGPRPKSDRRNVAVMEAGV